MNHSFKLQSKLSTPLHLIKKAFRSPHHLTSALIPSSHSFQVHLNIYSINTPSIGIHRTIMASNGRVPWDELIKFAEEKKAEEAESGKPAQLSKQQIAAVSQLIELVHDIEVEDFWVSELNQFCQQNKHAVPTFTSETFNQLVSGTPVPRSRVFCMLPSQNQKFPQEGRGYEAGQEVPTFKKAQKAKNFAAMHALKYLRNEDPSPRGSKRFASGTQESPAHTRIKTEEDNSDGGVSTGGPSHSHGKSVPARTSSNFTTQGPTIRERAAGLGCRLGFGIPEYHIEQDNDEEDTWSGRPIFKNDGRIPEDVGVVTGVVGRPQTEILVAEKVLEWLEKEEKAKQDQVASILSPTP